MEYAAWKWRASQTDLEKQWGGSRGKVHGLRNVILRIESIHVIANHDSLGCALLPNQQHCLPLLGYSLDEEFSPHVVHIGHQNGGVLWLIIWRVYILHHSLVPVLPFAWTKAAETSLRCICFTICYTSSSLFLFVYLLFFLLVHLDWPANLSQATMTGLFAWSAGYCISLFPSVSFPGSNSGGNSTNDIFV